MAQAETTTGAKLLTLSAGKSLNLAVLTPAALAEVFLPALLPADWLGKAEIDWTGNEGGLSNHLP